MLGVFILARWVIGAALIFGGAAAAMAVTQSSPSDASAARTFYGVAETKMKASDYKGAIDSFTEAIAADPTFGAAYLDRGNCYVRLGQLNTALPDFNKAVELLPANAAAFQDRGATRAQLGDDKGALEDFNRAVALAPTDQSVLIDRARVQIDLRLYEGARADYDHALQLNQSDVAYGYRAELRAFQRDFEGADADATAAMNLAPQEPLWVFVRGLIRYAHGQKDAGITDLTNAQDRYLAARDEDSARLTGALLEEMQSGKLPPEALFAQGSPIGSAVPPVDRATLALSFVDEGQRAGLAGRYQDAVAAYSKAVKLDPKNRYAFAGRGYTYLEMNQPRLAIKDLKHAIELGGVSAQAYFNLAAAYHALGDPTGAESALTALLRTQPNNYEARIERAQVLMMRRDIASAIADLGVAIHANPTSTRAYLMRGELRQLQHDYHGEIQDCTKVISLDANNAEAFYERAVARSGLRDWKGSLADLETAHRLSVAQGKTGLAEKTARMIEEVNGVLR